MICQNLNILLIKVAHVLELIMILKTALQVKLQSRAVYGAEKLEQHNQDTQLLVSTKEGVTWKSYIHR